MLGDGFSDRIKRLPKSIRDLARVHDAGDGWHDPLPTLYSALSVIHDKAMSVREHEKLFVAMAGDISWDGEPIAGDARRRRRAARPAPSAPSFNHPRP